MSPDNGDTLNVYIPCPKDLSNFNSDNGPCDARLIDPVTYNRHIVSPYRQRVTTQCGDSLGSYIVIQLDPIIKPLFLYDYFVVNLCLDVNNDGSVFESKEVIIFIRDDNELNSISTGLVYIWEDLGYKFQIEYNIITYQCKITDLTPNSQGFISFGGWFDQYDVLLLDKFITCETDDKYKTFDIGDWIPESIHPTINDPNLIFNNSCPVVFEDDSIFRVAILNWEGNVIFENKITHIVGDVMAIKNGISITIHDWTQEAWDYSAIIDISIDLTKIIPDGGRFFVYMEQILPSSTTYSYTSFDIFYDPNPVNPSFTNVTLYPYVENVKWTSGVARYSLNSKFDINFENLLNLINRSYPDDFLTIDLSLYFLPNKNLNPSDLNPWSNLWTYASNPVQVKNGYEIITPDLFFENPNGHIRASWTDWITGPLVTGSKFPMLIDTLLPISTDLAEEFVDENFRLLPDLSDYRDPTTLLNDDELQVYDNILVRKLTKDYTIYNPVNTANYTENYNDQYYYREFKSSQTHYYNGTFRLGGILSEDLILNKKIIIDISLDGINWFNCNTDYMGNPNLQNGDGCRVNRDSILLPDLQFTLGYHYVNENTGTAKLHQLTSVPYYGLFVRICFTSAFDKQLNYIRIVDWK